MAGRVGEMAIFLRRLKSQKKTLIKLFGELLEILQEKLKECVPKSWVLLTSLQAFYEHGPEVVCGAIVATDTTATTTSTHYH